MRVELGIAALVPDALDRELHFPLHIWRNVYPAHRVAIVGPHRHNLRLQCDPSLDWQLDVDGDSPADRLLVEAFDERATRAEVVNPNRNWKEGAATSHERTEDALVHAFVVNAVCRFHVRFRDSSRRRPRHDAYRRRITHSARVVSRCCVQA